MQIIPGTEHDLGGFFVRRVLPHRMRRSVGPFVFFDHMGPAEFPPGRGISVRPHPHIHLATVTYLFEGAIQHRDSLGSEQRIEPGAINWMTAGHGIVHSERAPDDLREKGGRLHGIQLWVALPVEHENVAPSFRHHPASEFPEFSLGHAKLRVLLGSVFGRESPVRVHSDLFYVDVQLPRGETLRVPAAERELAAYLVTGALENDGQAIAPYQLAVAGGDFTLTAREPSRFMLLGGKNLGPRFMDWNFVSSKAENIAAAKAEWAKGPGTARFPRVPGDDQEFIPLP